MSALSSKSAQEISALLDEYGIKHGPIVDSTRHLYEKKLSEAMSRETKGKPSPDKTFYREEQEEVTYIHYRTPQRNEGYGDSGRRYVSSEYTRESERDYGNKTSFSETEATYDSVSRAKPTLLKHSRDGSVKKNALPEKRFIPLWLQFLVFLVVTGFLYFVFTNMESPDENPFKKID